MCFVIHIIHKPSHQLTPVDISSDNVPHSRSLFSYGAFFSHVNVGKEPMIGGSLAGVLDMSTRHDDMRRRTNKEDIR